MIKNKITDAKKEYEEITLRAKEAYDKKEAYDNNMKRIDNMISLEK